MRKATVKRIKIERRTRIMIDEQVEEAEMNEFQFDSDSGFKSI